MSFVQFAFDVGFYYVSIQYWMDCNISQKKLLLYFICLLLSVEVNQQHNFMYYFAQNHERLFLSAYIVACLLHPHHLRHYHYLRPNQYNTPTQIFGSLLISRKNQMLQEIASVEDKQEAFLKLTKFIQTIITFIIMSVMAETNMYKAVKPIALYRFHHHCHIWHAYAPLNVSVLLREYYVVP